MPSIFRRTVPARGSIREDIDKFDRLELTKLAFQQQLVNFLTRGEGGESGAFHEAAHLITENPAHALEGIKMLFRVTQNLSRAYGALHTIEQELDPQVIARILQNTEVKKLKDTFMEGAARDAFTTQNKEVMESILRRPEYKNEAALKKMFKAPRNDDEKIFIFLIAMTFHENEGVHIKESDEYKVLAKDVKEILTIRFDEKREGHDKINYVKELIERYRSLADAMDVVYVAQELEKVGTHLALITIYRLVTQWDKPHEMWRHNHSGQIEAAEDIQIRLVKKLLETKLEDITVEQYGRVHGSWANIYPPSKDNDLTWQPSQRQLAAAVATIAIKLAEKKQDLESSATAYRYLIDQAMSNGYKSNIWYKENDLKYFGLEINIRQTGLDLLRKLSGKLRVEIRELMSQKGIITALEELKDTFAQGLKTDDGKLYLKMCLGVLTSGIAIIATPIIVLGQLPNLAIASIGLLVVAEAIGIYQIYSAGKVES